MKSFLLVFDPANDGFDYSSFLGNVDSEARKHEGIECLSRHAYMIPADKFLSFVSAIGVLAKVGEGRQIATCRYKCLQIEEDAQWLHFDGFPK